MNNILRYIIYAVAVIVYYYSASAFGANLGNTFVAFSVGVSAYCLFGWVLPGSQSNQGASDVRFASGIYQAVRLSSREAAARRRKV